MDCYTVHIRTGEVSHRNDRILKVFTDRSKAEEYFEIGGERHKFVYQGKE